MERKARKVIVGTVVSNKMDKTIVVEVQSFVTHPIYKKKLKELIDLKHMMNYKNVQLATKLLSWKQDLYLRQKRWRLVNIVEKAK